MSTTPSAQNAAGIVMEPKKFALVYQNGIANVFEVNHFGSFKEGRNAKRVFQDGGHYSGECFAKGCAAAGAYVATFVCNETGDIAEEVWDTIDPSNIYHAQYRPVCNV